MLCVKLCEIVFEYTNTSTLISQLNRGDQTRKRGLKSGRDCQHNRTYERERLINRNLK